MKQEIEISEMKRAEDYLRGYLYNGKLLRLDKNQRELFKDEQPIEIESLGEVPLSRARMFGIRHLINSLPNSDEKIFLYYHFIKGVNTENCAYLLGLSRASAFRMRRRAIAMVAIALREREKTESGGEED